MICAWRTPPVCRECSETRQFCECIGRPRQARYYDELENLMWMFCDGRTLRAAAVRAHEKEYHTRIRTDARIQARYWLTNTDREQAGYMRPDRDLWEAALWLGDRVLRQEVLLTAEAIYAIRFRDRVHPEDLRHLAEYWSERMSPAWHLQKHFRVPDD